MSDMTPLSALAGTGFAGRSGTTLTLREECGIALQHLEGPRSDADFAEVLTALGIDALPAIGHSSGNANAALLGIGPSIWLLVRSPRATCSAAQVSNDTIARGFAAAIDVSHAYTCIRIAGQKAQDLIAKGCALDVHPRHFPPGTCTAAGFAGMRVILWRAQDAAHFDLFVSRSYARSLWKWLRDATEQYADRTTTTQE
jgi:sarcosine oxidase subunit gamma